MSDLRRRLKDLEKPIVGRAKNIVFFLGDGMSIATVTAARVHMEQLSGSAFPDGNASLTFENFPYTGLVRVRYIIRYVICTMCILLLFVRLRTPEGILRSVNITEILRTHESRAMKTVFKIRYVYIIIYMGGESFLDTICKSKELQVFGFNCARIHHRY